MSVMSFVSAVLVTLIHSYNVVTYEIGGIIYWIETFVLNIARLAVPFFFMSSAYFLYRKEKIPVRKLYRNKFKSIVIPYLIWNTVYMVFFTVLQKFSLTNAGMKDITFVNILKGIFLYESNLAFWFMYKLIIFILLYPFILRVISINKRVAIGIITTILIAFIIFGDPINWVGYKILSLEALFYYLLGAFLGRYYREEIENTYKMSGMKRNAIIITGIVISQTIFVMIEVFKIEQVKNLIIIRNTAMIVSLFLILDYFSLKKVKKNQNLTFMIYCMHQMFLESLEKIVYIVLPKTEIVALADYFLAPMFVILMIWLISLIMKKFPKISAVLYGGRT